MTCLAGEFGVRNWACAVGSLPPSILQSQLSTGSTHSGCPLQAINVRGGLDPQGEDGSTLGREVCSFGGELLSDTLGLAPSGQEVEFGEQINIQGLRLLLFPVATAAFIQSAGLRQRVLCWDLWASG